MDKYQKKSRDKVLVELNVHILQAGISPSCLAITQGPVERVRCDELCCSSTVGWMAVPVAADTDVLLHCCFSQEVKAVLLSTSPELSAAELKGGECWL